MVAHGLSIAREHAGGAMIPTLGPARLAKTPVVAGCPVSPPGGDAALVLAQVGLAHRLGDLAAPHIIALE